MEMMQNQYWDFYLQTLSADKTGALANGTGIANY